MKYAECLKSHLSGYKRYRLGVDEDGIYKKNGQAYGHILPVDLKKLNILEGIRAEFWRDLEEGKLGSVKLHTDFHHLNSSQAMAFNLFYPFMRETGGLQLILNAFGVARDDSGKAIFEYEPNPIEKTNFDFAIKYDDGSCVTCEVKLTESGFGTVTGEQNHQDKFRAHYEVDAARVLVPDKAEMMEFFKDYQLYRNVMHLSKNPRNYSVFLHPEANESFKETEAKLDDALRPEYRSRAKVVHLEDLIPDLAETAKSGVLEQHLTGFSEKYVMPS